MSHRQKPPAPSRSSRSPQSETAGNTAPLNAPMPTLAAPKPVRPAQSLLRAPEQQWAAKPSPPGYTSFPPPPSPAPNAAAGRPSPSPGVQSATASAGGAGAAPPKGLKSPGPNVLTSFPPPPPTPPQRDAASYFPPAPDPSKQSKPAAVAARVPATTDKVGGRGSVSETELRPGVFDIDNLKETLQNLRFAPSPMLSTIYSCPSTPREEPSTPDFTASTTSSCLTPPSTNPTPEPMVLTPRRPPPRSQEPATSPPTARPRANSRRASPPSRKRGRGVVSCIDTPVTFATTWYTHPTVPSFHVCSRCYEDHLFGTRFENDFRGKVYDDRKPRACRFSKPRIRDHLLRQALITGRIEDLTSFLRVRGSVPDCRGLDGARGGRGTKWYRPKNNAVPNMVVCEACYEDHVLPFRAAANFEPTPAQPANDVWACDLAVPCIRNAYRLKAARDDDWEGFAAEAAARMSVTPCPGRQRVAVGSREWFTPTAAGAEGVLICAACYRDHVGSSGEEHRWRDAGDDDDGLASRYGSMVRCTLGHFNVGVAMARAQETRDFSVFWRALDVACREESCDPQGITDGRWYTFPSHPEGFSVCAACVAAVAEPLGLASSFIARCGVPPGSTRLCSLNPASPRFVAYMARLLEGFFVADAKPLESYALEFASIPLCPRDEDFKNGRWYGWRDCAVCPSCYHEFARGTPLAASMQLKGETVPGSLMCEMYSPRMRSLYTQACSRSPPDPAPLLEAARARRSVYFETVPEIRQIINEAQIALGRRRMSNVMSSSNGAMGQARDISLKSSFINNVSTSETKVSSFAAEFASGSKSLVLERLERRWREVE